MKRIVAMNLLHLTDETRYYLKAFLAKKLALRDYGKPLFVSMNDENGCFFAAPPYQENPPEKPVQTEAPESSSWLSSISNFFASGFGFFSTTSESSSAKPVEPEPVGEPCSLRLSHHLLVRQLNGKFHCFFIAKNPFAQGGFGYVFHVPGQIILNSNDEGYEIVSDAFVAKVGLDYCRHRSDIRMPKEYGYWQEDYPASCLLRNTVYERASFPVRIPQTMDPIWLIVPRIPGVPMDMYDIDNLPIADKFKIAISLIDNLMKFHTPGQSKPARFHNDIKPQNIIIGPDKIGRYCDFGAMTNAGEAADQYTAHYSAHSKNASENNANNDKHSLGIVLFQLFLEKEQLDPNIPRTLHFPKGTLKHIQNDWGKKITAGTRAVKVMDNPLWKCAYKFTHFRVNTSSAKVNGLTKEEASALFKVLKNMRKENPISLEEARRALLSIKDCENEYGLVQAGM